MTPTVMKKLLNGTPNGAKSKKFAIYNPIARRAPPIIPNKIIINGFCMITHQ